MDLVPSEVDALGNDLQKLLNITDEERFQLSQQFGPLNQFDYLEDREGGYPQDDYNYVDYDEIKSFPNKTSFIKTPGKPNFRGFIRPFITTGFGAASVLLLGTVIYVNTYLLSLGKRRRREAFLDKSLFTNAVLIDLFYKVFIIMYTLSS